MILNDTDKYKKMAVIDSSIDCEDTSNLTTKISEQYDVERYIPEPIDTSDVNLSNELLELTELIAENVHETWALSRILEGWVYGIHKDDSLKTTPCLVPYKELPDSEKEYDRKTALETLKLVIKLGYKITK